MANRFKISHGLKICRQFAAQEDLVEFGRISSSDENVEHVLGISRVASHANLLYAHGNYRGQREVSLLVRKFLVNVDAAPKTLTWVILRFKLSINDLPKILVDTHQAGNEMYRYLTEILTTYQHMTHALESTETNYHKQLHVFSALQDNIILKEYLRSSLLSKFLHEFPSLSFELGGNQILVYSDIKHINYLRLQNMLNCGLWLSEEMEYVDAQLHGHSEN